MFSLLPRFIEAFPTKESLGIEQRQEIDRWLIELRTCVFSGTFLGEDTGEDILNYQIFDVHSVPGHLFRSKEFVIPLVYTSNKFIEWKSKVYGRQYDVDMGG